MPVTTGAEAVKPREKGDAIIWSINFLDENNNILPGTSIQYVNLPKEQKYVDGAIVTHKEQLGRNWRCKVKFNQKGSFKFRMKLEPKKDLRGESKNATYSDVEKNRNADFKYQEQEKEYVTDSNGEKIIPGDDFFVTPAGGDVFTLSATDNANNKKTLEIQTKRKMYYVEFKMPGFRDDCAQSLTDFRQEYEKHGIVFQGLPEVTLAQDMANIGTEEEQAAFKKMVLDAYENSAGRKMDPYCIAIAYTGHLAVKDAGKRIRTRIRGGRTTPVMVGITYKKKGDTKKEKHYLWHNIDDGDWFVDCYFVPDGTVNTLLDTFSVSDFLGYGRIPVSRDKITLNNPAAGSNSVKVDVSLLPEEMGTLTLIVNCVGKMKRGSSLGDTNVAAICTKSNWKKKSDAEQCLAIVHEVGHQIDMTPNPDSQRHKWKLLDKGKYHYDDAKGHTGDHCHSGLPPGWSRYDGSLAGEKPDCVMFGATEVLPFCQDCAQKVRKVDLSKGVKK